jgi:hypothetical protein
MPCLSCYHLCLLFNKIGKEGRIGSAWKQGGGGSQRGWGGGRDGPNDVCIKIKKRNKNNFMIEKFQILLYILKRIIFYSVKLE